MARNWQNIFQSGQGFAPQAVAQLSGMEVDLATALAYVNAGSLTVVNVKGTAYGAVGDGVTNDRAAIQAAIDSLTSPGIVFLPAGTYRIATALVMKTGVILQGAGAGVTVIANSSAGLDSLRFVSGSGVVTAKAVVRDLTITKSGAGTPSAAVNLTRYATILFENVEFTYHVYGNYHYWGEQNTFRNCVFQNNTYGTYLDGGGTASASNFNEFDKCYYSGNTYDVYHASSAYKNSWRNSPFYASSTASIYVAAAATAVLGSMFDGCWWEATTGSIIDLRGGSGFAFVDCLLADNKDFITAANFSHPQLRVRDLIDISAVGRSISAVDYELTDRNPINNNILAQLSGSYKSEARDSVHIPNLVARGFGGRVLVTPGLSAGAGEKNFIVGVDFSSGAQWAVAAGVQPTGGFSDPLNGTAAYRLLAGSQVYQICAAVNGGAAMAGATITFQVWARSAGGRLQVNLSDNAFAGGVTKFTRLLNSQWTLCSFTIALPAGATGTGVAALLAAADQNIDLYWPGLVLGRNITPRLPVSRDMSAWTGPYETFGPVPNIRVYVNNAAPTVGTWAVGDEAVNYAPVAAGTDRWRCTTAGTPGTWKAVAVAA